DAAQIRALLSSMDAPAGEVGPPLENPEGPPTAGALGLTDLREFEALRTGLDRLHMARAGLEWSSYVNQSLSRMAKFLGLEGEREAGWRAAMKQALADSLAARRRMEAIRARRGDVREAWATYREEQSKAIAGLDPFLDGSPRHRVFRDHGPRWLFLLEGHPNHSDKPQ